MFFGGYGGPVGRLSAVSGKVATLAGFEGGVLIGERLSFGGAAYRMTWRQGRPLLDEAGNDYTLRMRYGGFNVGVTLWRPSILEFQIESLLGAGVACVSTAGDYSDDNGRCVETVKMFVGEPGAAMYINVTDWMRVAITGGYRVVVREPWRPPNEYLLSGGYGGIDLHFGWFRKPPPRRRR